MASCDYWSRQLLANELKEEKPMKRLLLIMGATALLVAPYHAQVQTARTQTDMTTSEFRQVLVDMGSYLDAHKGTNLARQFAAMQDNTLSTIYTAVANPRQ